jgi:hypothetical protein
MWELKGEMQRGRTAVRSTVRAGTGGAAMRVGPMRIGGGGRRRRCRADCNRRGCVGCAQSGAGNNLLGNGGVVRMEDGAVTFKGSTIDVVSVRVLAPICIGDA